MFTGSVRKSFLDGRSIQNGLPESVPSMEDRVLKSFRAKSELLISQINDLDNVQYDENISSDEESTEVAQ